MKNKGFTVMELLAVIVVIAILSIVAIPELMKAITSSKSSSAEVSVEGYVKALEDELVAQQFKSALLKDGSYDIDDSKISDVDFKGTLPEEGWVTIEDGEVIEGEFLLNGFVIEFDGKKASYNKNRDSINSKPSN